MLKKWKSKAASFTASYLPGGKELVHTTYFGLVFIDGHGSYTIAAAVLFGFGVIAMWGEFKHKGVANAELG